MATPTKAPVTFHWVLREAEVWSSEFHEEFLVVEIPVRAAQEVARLVAPTEIRDVHWEERVVTAEA